MLKPEVAGQKGDATVITNYDELRSGATLYPNVTKLEYEFYGWLGDELLESFPCFVVTSDLAESIKTSGLTGVEFFPVKVSKSDFFIEAHDRDLPPFVWLVSTGRVVVDATGELQSWTGHDFSLSQRAELVVTDKSLAVLRQHRIGHCEITPLRTGD
jgi:hypothetical protein